MTVIASTAELPESTRPVVACLAAANHDHPVVLLPDSARTAVEAAAALGCSVAQIAKSIVFRRLADDAAVLVVASGSNRVDEAKVAALVGPIGRADARFVRQMSGYAIGGVPPIAHATPPVTLLDQDLFALDALWAAAGHPHAVFRLTAAQLAELTGARAVDVAVAPAP